MILSDNEIEAERAANNIVIMPFDRRNLGSDTYDVRLGEFYYYEEYPSRDQIFNPLDPKSVERVWGEFNRAICVEKSEWWIENKGSLPGWKQDDRVIFLDPGETILAHTIEFIGGVHGITTKMFSRSSIGRALLGVCKCAGRGDVGYFNRWTMEITSFARGHVIPLKVGMRIAQIEFLRVGETRQVYGVDRGKYQQGSGLQDMMRDWTPGMMLPKLYNDFEV